MAATQSSNSSSAIESATRLHNLWFFIYVGVLVIAAALTYVVWRTGNNVQRAIQTEADARIAEAGAEGGRANERAGNLEVEAAQLRIRAAEAERQLLELKERTTPRIITDAQKSIIASAMAGLAVLPAARTRQSVAVFSTSTAFESAALAEGTGFFGPLRR
jgi:hypothetical protein